MTTGTIRLKGMTWSHPRGYDPLVACAGLYARETGVEIGWDQRSLQDFESFPVEELARAYDLIVIDHPHVGQVTREGCLVPLDIEGREADGEALLAGSVGPSYRSYHFEGRQWALPIDAATPVLAYRPDLLETPPSTWAEVLAMADQGRVLLPLRPPHSLMAFFSIAAQQGTPCTVLRPELIGPEAGIRAYRLMHEVSRRVADVAYDIDPIEVFERMAEEGSALAVAPLLYGYVSYAADGFRPHRLAFADMPVLEEGSKPDGSALGGTGIAVSAYSAHRSAAIDFAYWLASAEVQRGPYAQNGGQPGHSAAWVDEAVNAPVHGFYRNTRATLEGAFVRPRHDGYMAFQEQASARINLALKAGEDGEALVADLNRLFAESFPA